VSGRNRIAGALALLGVVVVVVGTFLPLVEVEPENVPANAFIEFNIEDGANGWDSELNDGPIHAVVLLVPLAMGILLLLNRARILAKILLIISAVIGFFWVFVRFADINGWVEESELLQEAKAAAQDPGIGIWVVLIGWVIVLVAGLISRASRPRPAVTTGPYAQPYQAPPPA
jgi:hypothetical protein